MPLSDTDREKVRLAAAIRPLVTDGEQQTAFVKVLTDLAQQERDEVETVLAQIGRPYQDGIHEVTLTPELARTIEHHRTRQQVYEEALVSYLVALVNEAVEITGREDLRVEEGDPA